MTLHQLLPLLTDGPHGSRSAATCHYRCADACFKPMPNTSDNPEFHEVALRMISAQGGIFGWVGSSSDLLAALPIGARA